MARNRTRALPGVALIAILAVALAEAPAQAAPAGPDLATAASFAVLAATTVTNTGASTISGDLGVSPGTAITGFGPGVVAGGSIHSADAVALAAQNDLTTAYNTAAGLPPSSNVTADLGGQRLVPGVYAGPTLSLTGALTLDAGGNPNAVFVFQAGSTLITASASSVLLVGGADPCHVYWQVGSSATLGSHSTFVGSVLALASVTANTGATVLGRLLARTAAVTLDTNTVTRPLCAAAIAPTVAPATAVPAPPPASSTPTATPTPTPPPVPAPTATPSAATPVPTPTASAAAPSAPVGATPQGVTPSASVPAAAPSAPVPSVPTASAKPVGPGSRLANARPGTPTSSPAPSAPTPAATTGGVAPVDFVHGLVAAPPITQLPRTGAPVADLVRYALLALALGLLALASSRRRPAARRAAARMPRG